MESIIRNVRDIDSSERQALEYILGKQLKENQKIIIQIVTLAAETVEQEKVPDVPPATKLPDWCNVFEGLSDEQIVEVEGVVLRRVDLSRPSE